MTLHKAPIPSSILIALTLTATSAIAQWNPAPIPEAAEQGDKTRTPIIFVHGQNGAGDQFERQWMHFTSNGYPHTWVVPFDYNSAIRGKRPARGTTPTEPYSSLTTDDLDAFIDAVRARTGFDKINLVGHSRGTFESGAYLSDPDRAAKVAHYATIGGADATNPNDVPSIGISGLGDIRPGPAASNGGKVGWMPAYQDHVMVCTSDESFWELFTFFNDGEKPSLFITHEDRPQIAGYAKSYIHNTPLGGATVEFWEVNNATGHRTGEIPLVSLTVNEKGAWGPFTAKAGQAYEIVVQGTQAKRPPRFFRSPWTHSDRMVYLRIAADAEGYTANPFDKAEHLLTDDNPVFVVRHQNGSLLPGVMSLSINGIELIRPPIIETTTDARQSPTVALYLADGNANKKSDLTTVDGFGGAFVNSADIYIPADPNSSVQFRLNNHTLNVPALPASEAGPISIIFEDFN